MQVLVYSRPGLYRPREDGGAVEPALALPALPAGSHAASLAVTQHRLLVGGSDGSVRLFRSAATLHCETLHRVVMYVVLQPA